MTDGAPQDLAPCIEKIHAAPMQAVVWATGGGFQVGNRSQTWNLQLTMCLCIVTLAQSGVQSRLG